MTVQAVQPVQTLRLSFAYRAQTHLGDVLSGTVDALDLDDARRRLEALSLHVIEIAPARPEMTSRALTSEDFFAFNQQLAQLAAAGLPIEHGLRLIAEDMRRGRLAGTIRQIASELEAGKPLADVFARHQSRFPALYGQLLDAGIRSNNLPGVLHGLSRHLQMMRRLRGILWRAAAYPLMVLAGLSIVLLFLSLTIVPQFESIFHDFKVALPVVTRATLTTARWLPHFLIAFLALLAAIPVLLVLVRSAGLGGALRDHLILPLPLVGLIVHKSLLAGWCNVLHLAVAAGQDLPAALQLAADTCGSPRLRGETEALVNWLARGNDLASAPPGRLLPASAIVAMDLAARSHDLPTVLRSLAEMYQQQADMRLESLPALLTPLLILLVAGLIGFIVIAMLMPIISLLGAISGFKF